MNAQRTRLLVRINVLTALILVGSSCAGGGVRAIPSGRLSSGAAINFGAEPVAQYTLDVTGGVRLNPYRVDEDGSAESNVFILPEIGYTYSTTDAHHFTAGVNPYYQFSSINFGPSLDFLIGTGGVADDLVLGLRAGLRFDLLAGFISFEPAYEWRRELDGGDFHTLRLVVAIDLGMLTVWD